MKSVKYFAIVISVILLFACFLSGCNGNEQGIEVTLAPTSGSIIIGPTDPPAPTDYIPNTDEIENTPTSTPTPYVTNTPTVAPTNTPTPTPAEPTPYTDKYLNIVDVLNVYVNPGELAYVCDLSGSISDWQISNNTIADLVVDNGKLYIKGKNTGVAILTGSGNSGDKVYAYCLKPMPENDDTKVVAGLPYMLYFEKASHTITVYKDSGNGYYTVPIKTISSASGSTPSKTPSGLHTLQAKMEWKTFSATCYAPFAIQYASGVYLHGPCYEFTRRNSILSYYYNSIGESSSGGCLRMQIANIMWIYDNCEIGTKLLIVDSAELGTASIKPADISDSACYDPTDPLLKDR